MKASLITISMARVIRSPRARVWRALTLPAELIRWDSRRSGLEHPAPDYPSVGQTARWRSWAGRVTLPQQEEPLEVVPNERLRSQVRLGSFHFEETYTLSDQPMGTTRLALTISARSTVPLLGVELDRFDVRRLATERVGTTLELLQRWCEGGGVERRVDAAGAPG